MRDRLRQACEELSGIEGSLDGSGAAPVQAGAQAFLALAFENAANSLTEVRRMLEVLNESSAGEQAGTSSQLARHLALLQVLTETVAVLERTKSSFKSRELADLRRKIEGLLRSDLAPEGDVKPEGREPGHS